MLQFRRNVIWARAAIMLGLALMLASTSVLLVDAIPAEAAFKGKVGDATSSAVTVKWIDGARDTTDPNYDNFKNISVTVSQTKNLSHQGISVSWSGATPTSTVQFAQNYFQAMQCWADDPRACQFGQPQPAVVDKTGAQVQSRILEPSLDPGQAAAMTDDLLASEAADGTKTFMYPFVSYGGAITFKTAELFSSSTSNEISASPTAGDGTGMFTFEAQTTLEAPHLGCGGDDGSGSPVPCYLVIVPRGNLELDGSKPLDPAGAIGGSPLSFSAWKNRIVIPLSFSPVSASCPLGQNEVRLVGNEVITKAMTSWQPALCQQGTTFGFSRLGDDEARDQITSTELGSSHLAMVSEPLEPTSGYAPGTDYAPIAQSAVVVAYNIDYSLKRDSPLYAAKNGTKVRNLRLNQRLVAKLLTQSYPSETPGFGSGNPTVQANPAGLNVDPEFLALNPDFVDFTAVSPPGLMVSFGNADMNKHVWEWIRHNPEAKAFIEGQPDEWGMKVNPVYSTLAITEGEAPVSFPKADLSVYSPLDGVPPYGTLDMRPYYTSIDETAARALRADPNIKTSWDPMKLPSGQYISQGAQTLGQRFMLALTDLSSAYRYGLDVAELQGSVSGNYVSPDATTIGTAVANQVETGIAGVRYTDWAKPVPNAYPLAEVVFAAVNICTATDAERAAYASFITWVSSATGGQTQGNALGQLPEGYTPISDAQRSAGATAIADIQNPANKESRCPQSLYGFGSFGLNSNSTLSDSFDESTDEETEGGPKLFIRTPYYGEGATTPFTPGLTRFLTAGGYIAGLPLLLTGLFLQRRSLRQLELEHPDAQ